MITLQEFEARCRNSPYIAVYNAELSSTGQRAIKQTAINLFIDEYGGDITLFEVLKDISDEIMDKNKEMIT